jgi:hypothetical protein
VLIDLFDAKPKKQSSHMKIQQFRGFYTAQAGIFQNLIGKR